MSMNELRQPKVHNAPRGSKRGWVTVASQLPPDLAERLVIVEGRKNLARTDVVRIAVEEYVEREAA